MKLLDNVCLVFSNFPNPISSLQAQGHNPTPSTEHLLLFLPSVTPNFRTDTFVSLNLSQLIFLSGSISCFNVDQSPISHFCFLIPSESVSNLFISLHLFLFPSSFFLQFQTHSIKDILSIILDPFLVSLGVPWAQGQCFLMGRHS